MIMCINDKSSIHDIDHFDINMDVEAHADGFRWSFHGVMAKVLDCRLEISKFKLQLHWYVHFQTNALGKGMNSLILPNSIK